MEGREIALDGLLCSPVRTVLARVGEPHPGLTMEAWYPGVDHFAWFDECYSIRGVRVGMSRGELERRLAALPVLARGDAVTWLLQGGAAGDEPLACLRADLRGGLCGGLEYFLTFTDELEADCNI